MALFKVLRNTIAKTYMFQQCSYISSQVKVTLCGAGNTIGQPLGLLLKQSPLIDELSLFDCQEISSLAMELSYIDTNCVVNGYSSGQDCTECYKDSNIVVIVSGLHSTSEPAMEKTFPQNAAIVQEIVTNAIKFCPQALIVIGTNPVEALVPVASEKLKYAGVYHPNRVFGITTINVIRTNTFAASVLDLEPESVLVPVLGGNLPGTIIPILSQALPCNNFTHLEIENITKSVQNAHSVIEKLQNNEDPALASAFGMARFIISLVKGLKGMKSILEYAFVRTNDIPPLKYCTVPVMLGSEGVQKLIPIPEVSPYEQCLINDAIPIIKCWTEKGNAFVGKIDTAICDPCARLQKNNCEVEQCEANKKLS